MDSIKRMPVIFAGHGDPMMALRKDFITESFKSVGQRIRTQFGTPKAILAVSAHWYADDTWIQSADVPEQVYDMYGFPQELYEVKYPVKGNLDLTNRVLEILGDHVSVNDDWGIDHGTWTVLVHMFPGADIPVVQLSVNKHLTADEHIYLGKKLAALRDERYLIFGSGNVVHNLFRVDWNNPSGTAQTEEFNRFIIDNVMNGNIEAVTHYKDHPDGKYSVPTPDHYIPLLYCLGASDGDNVEVYNNVCNLGTMAMTGFLFGMEA